MKPVACEKPGHWYMVVDVALCHDCNNCFMADKDEYVGNDWPGYTTGAIDSHICKSNCLAL